jgi:hypothetical protein
MVIAHAVGAEAQTSTKLPQALRALGAEPIRQVESDICFPATAEEYDRLGGNAILMLNASSAVSTELPLKSVYVLRTGVRIQLQKVDAVTKHVDAGGHATQVSYYLLPIQLMKADAELLADFAGASGPRLIASVPMIARLR